MENPQPQTCRRPGATAGLVLGQQADRGLVSQVEEIASSGDKVMVAVHMLGADQRLCPHGRREDRSYLVLTMGRGRIVALRDFRDRDEPRGFAGLGQGKRRGSRILHVPECPGAEALESW